MKRFLLKLLRKAFSKMPQVYLVSAEIPYMFLRSKNNDKLSQIFEFNIVASNPNQATEIASELIHEFNLKNNSNFFVTKIKVTNKELLFSRYGKPSTLKEIVIENTDNSINLSKYKLKDMSKGHVNHQLEIVLNYVFEHDNPPNQVYFN